MPAPSDYREYKPPEHLAAHVECFWTHAPRNEPARVVPDTCVDLIFSRDAGTQVVGSMTRYLLTAPNANRLFGARLRAGAVQSILSLPLRELCDKVVPLADLVSPRHRPTERQFDEQQTFRLLEQFLSPARALSPVQLAIGHLAAHGGAVRLDDAARECGLSLRQFRRHCIAQTGVSPKTLARIGRFRKAWEQSLEPGRTSWADLALDCGYFDQAHLVSDFVEFSGFTPGAFRRMRRA